MNYSNGASLEVALQEIELVELSDLECTETEGGIIPILIAIAIVGTGTGFGLGYWLCD